MNQDFFGNHYEEPPGSAAYSSFRELLWTKYAKRYIKVLHKHLESNRFLSGTVGMKQFAATPYTIGKIQIVRINLFRKTAVQIYADIILDAELALTYNYRGQSHIVTETHCFYIRVLMDLTEHDHFDQTVEEIGIWNDHIPAPGRTLDEFLIPHTGKDDFNRIANEILLTYLPGAMEHPIKNLGKLLAEKLGLNIRYAKLSEDGTIRGKFFFEGGSVYWEDPDGTSHRVYFRGKTIIIDRNACCFGKSMPRNELINDTILHECVHAYEHFLFYLGQRHCMRQISAIACSMPGVKTGTVIEQGFAMKESRRMDLALSGEFKISSKSPIDWIEWQACKTTPRISMPEGAVTRAVDDFLRDQRQKHPSLPPDRQIENAVKYVARTFCVSVQSAKQRLIEIGYDQARGVMNYVGGKYIRNYGFAPGTLSDNQTFTIEFANAMDIYQKDEEFRACLQSGKFIFIENHFCLACKPYIGYRNGHPYMTTYARQHMDECCIIFTTYGENLGHNYSRGFLLHKKCQKAYDAEFSFMPADSCEIFATYKKVENILRALPASPSLTLCAHMERKKITIEDLCELSDISRTIICRLRTDDEYRPRMQTAVAVCIGLKLHPSLRKDWMVKLGYNLDSTKEGRFWGTILDLMYSKSIHEVNDELIRQGYKPLTRGAS